METIKIFLASSSELVNDRKEFREFLSVENDLLHKKGKYLELVQWEHFLDSVSHTRLQDEYNEAIKNSQIVLCLFYTKAGRYTQEEFDTALKYFKESGSPLIYTYFKSGTPKPDPNDQRSLDLIAFKNRLSDLGHFYSTYNNIHDLKLQFRKQMDRLEDNGYLALRDEIKAKTNKAVTNYINITGSNNIIIQGVSESSITVNINGQFQEIDKKLDSLMAIMENTNSKMVHTSNRSYNKGRITNQIFDIIVDKASREITLPLELTQDLIEEEDGWVRSLQRELERKQRISVGNSPMKVIQNFGWLVETYLQKLLTEAGRKKNLRRLSFMTEAWHSSLRYLCYIQVSQLLHRTPTPKLTIVSDFFGMGVNEYLLFDYMSLLLTTTETIGSNGFVREIEGFVNELSNKNEALYSIAHFLEDQRKKLIAGEIEEDDGLSALLDEYLTALIYWLRKISFLARYRLVSIKEINLDYRLGTAKNFVHLYGELHGFYNDSGSAIKDYDKKWVEDAFTYNKSILLFKGSDVSYELDRLQKPGSYLSLSPIVIDQSVYVNKPTQTPEIFYYSGHNKTARSFYFLKYQNELTFDINDRSTSNKSLEVMTQNNKQHKLDELHEQLNEIFKPFKV